MILTFFFLESHIPGSLSDKESVSESCLPLASVPPLSGFILSVKNKFNILVMWMIEGCIDSCFKASEQFSSLKFESFWKNKKIEKVIKFWKWTLFCPFQWSLFISETVKDRDNPGLSIKGGKRYFYLPKMVLGTSWC